MTDELFPEHAFETVQSDDTLLSADTEVIEVLSREEDDEREFGTVSIFPHDNKRTLQVSVKQDAFTEYASRAFDVKFVGVSESQIWSKPDVPELFGLGLIVGSSGSGKSTLLREFGEDTQPHWDADRAIVSHFETADEATERLMATGLNSIPTWLRPYSCLSTGEKFRADLARKLHDRAVIDEFTSVVNRDVACATSRALRRHVTQRGLIGLVIASCHRDIIEWLEPDWTFDTDSGDLVVGRSLRRPRVEVSIYPCASRAWAMFARHHYLSADLSRSARCFLGVWRDNVVGFVGALPFPSGMVENAWREHRLVVLPDFQGLGIGMRLSDAVAQMFLEQGKRYYSRTAHPKLGFYRERSSLWRSTSHGATTCTPMGGDRKSWRIDTTRVCFAHEYIGRAS